MIDIKELAADAAKDIQVPGREWSTYYIHHDIVLAICTKFLAAVDAASNKQGSVAVIDESDDGKYVDILPNVDVKIGDLLYLHPATTPQAGYVLAPVEPTEAMIESFYSKVEVQKTGAIRHFNAGYKAMIEAAKVAP